MGGSSGEGHRYQPTRILHTRYLTTKPSLPKYFRHISCDRFCDHDRVLIP
jgi:hypothetical protein